MSRKHLSWQQPHFEYGLRGASMDDNRHTPTSHQVNALHPNSMLGKCIIRSVTIASCQATLGSLGVTVPRPPGLSLLYGPTGGSPGNDNRAQLLRPLSPYWDFWRPATTEQAYFFLPLENLGTSTYTRFIKLS